MENRCISTKFDADSHQEQVLNSAKHKVNLKKNKRLTPPVAMFHITLQNSPSLVLKEEVTSRFGEVSPSYS